MWLSYLTYLRKLLNAHFYKSSSRVCKNNHDRCHQVPALSLALNAQGGGNYHRQEIEKDCVGKKAISEVKLLPLPPGFQLQTPRVVYQ